jgi:hypothetical protein
MNEADWHSNAAESRTRPPIDIDIAREDPAKGPGGSLAAFFTPRERSWPRASRYKAASRAGGQIGAKRGERTISGGAAGGLNPLRRAGRPEMLALGEAGVPRRRANCVIC